MKILLVNPDAPNTFWSLKNTLRFISKKAMLPPLGILTVAAMLPKEWELRLVDMATKKLRDRDILWADYVFITGMYVQKVLAKAVIERCKKLKKTVVAGGPLYTSSPEEFPEVDHLVLNEGEITLPEFLKDLENGTPKRIYSTTKFADVQLTPAPLWEMLDMRHYGMASVQYSRGCPFNCHFCDITKTLGHRMRTKTKEQVLQELDNIYSAGWRGSVFFVDDNFIGNKSRLKEETLPAIIDWMGKKDYPFSFNTQASINLADDDELMRLMVDAGFDCVFVGIESQNAESLVECNKTQNTGRNLVESIKKIQYAGMQVQGGFILGFDSDKANIFENTIQFIQKSGIVTAMVGLLNAPPGTQLQIRMSEENRMLKIASGDNTDFSMNFIPKMNKEDLIAGYKKVVKTIYSQKFYYERILTFLKNFNPSQKVRAKVGYPEIKAIFKSMWIMGILNKGRTHYWKLIFWSLRRPQYFSTAIRLTVFGFHFRKVFNSYGTA
jgi:radical SAM superfamily enzyme YgiQ (UPF0313 family)